MRNISLEYIAGIIDGEGTISICKWKSYKYKRRFVPTLAIYNTNLSCLEIIKFTLQNGKIKTRQRNGNRKRSYELVFTANEIRNILPKIKPFLIIKEKQAELLAAALSILKHGVRPSVIEEIKLNKIVDSIRLLNKRGN